VSSLLGRAEPALVGVVDRAPRRFALLRDRQVSVGLGIIAVFVVVAVLAPVIAP